MAYTYEQLKELAEKMRFMSIGASPFAQRAVAQAARFQETVTKIAIVLGRPANEVADELKTWVQSLVWTYDEMLPIAYRNVMAALPMTRIPKFKQMEIETGRKGMVMGDGRYHTWEEIIPFEV